MVRHAKSDWSIAGLKDIDRPLNQRGYSDAHRVGKRLGEILSGKIIFISSTAVRAMTTALIFAGEINYPEEKILLTKNLYEAEPAAYENEIFSLDDNFETVLIFGHNPTISLVANQLSKTQQEELPTCSVTIINIQTDRWAEAFSAGSAIQLQLFPKLLVDEG